MSLQFCTGCTAAYSVGAPACPQCGSTDYTDTPPSEQPAPAEPAAEAETPTPKRRSKPTPADEPAEAPAP